MNKARIMWCVTITLIAFAGAVTFYSCQKDSLNSTKQEQAEKSIKKQQKWNPNDDAFVLPEAMQPYQYAVSLDNLTSLLNHMQSIFDSYKDGEERGYFILSLNANAALVNYGFITKVSSYYNPDIFKFPFIDINDIDDGGDDSGEMMVYGCKTKDKESANKVKFDKWVAQKIHNGWQVCQGENADGTYWAHAKRCR
jgi:hypothetical protein